jgi:hypothetical protein
LAKRIKKIYLRKFVNAVTANIHKQKTLVMGIVDFFSQTI